MGDDRAPGSSSASLRHSGDHFAVGGDRARRVRRHPDLPPDATRRPTTSIQLLVVLELVLTVTASTATGGLASPFVLTPVTGLLLAGYVWGRRATVGTAIAGVIAAAATIAMQSVDATDQRSAGQIAVVFLLCGALGAFTRNLIAEIESHRAAAIDQAAEMATANELLVSLHALAADAAGVVRPRARSSTRCASGCGRSSGSARSSCSSATTRSRCGRVELAEGVRLPAHLTDDDLPAAAPARAHQRRIRSSSTTGSCIPTRAASRRWRAAVCTRRCAPGARSSG